MSLRPLTPVEAFAAGNLAEIISRIGPQMEANLSVLEFRDLTASQRAKATEMLDEHYSEFMQAVRRLEQHWTEWQE